MLQDLEGLKQQMKELTLRPVEGANETDQWDELSATVKKLDSFLNNPLSIQQQCVEKTNINVEMPAVSREKHTKALDGSVKDEMCTEDSDESTLPASSSSDNSNINLASMSEVT